MSPKREQDCNQNGEMFLEEGLYDKEHDEWWENYGPGRRAVRRSTIGIGMSAGGGCCNRSPVRTSSRIARSSSASPLPPATAARVIKPLASAQIRTCTLMLALLVREF